MARKRTASPREGDIIARLHAALDGKMKEIEERLASGEGLSAADSERDARTLTSLARLYEKLSELESAGLKADQQEAADGERNADAIRDEIASRLERLLQGEQD